MRHCIHLLAGCSPRNDAPKPSYDTVSALAEELSTSKLTAAASSGNVRAAFIANCLAAVTQWCGDACKAIKAHNKSVQARKAEAPGSACVATLMQLIDRGTTCLPASFKPHGEYGLDHPSGVLAALQSAAGVPVPDGE